MSKRVNPILIGRRRIGPGASCFIIAEAGVNHNGKLSVAKKMVDLAKKAGADAIKFQSFKADQLAILKAPKAAYQKRTTGSRESQLDMLRRLELLPDMHHALLAYCRRKRILFLSSPFDEESADLLETLKVPAFKMASGEITNLPFLRYVARKGKPMIVSTGMSTLAEVKSAVQTIYKAGNKKLILLHCVSNYPADPKDINLRAMDTLASSFKVPIGFSDHTQGIEVALAAVAKGSRVIEKHLTLDRTMPGPDHQASLEPGEFAAMVKGIRIVEQAMGHGRKEPAASEKPIAAVARRSLVAARDIPAGATVTSEMIAIKRPGIGISPADLSRLIGKSARRAISSDTLLNQEMFR